MLDSTASAPETVDKKLRASQMAEELFDVASCKDVGAFACYGGKSVDRAGLLIGAVKMP